MGFGTGIPGNGPNPAGIELSGMFSAVTSDQNLGPQTPTRRPAGTLPRQETTLDSKGKTGQPGGCSVSKIQS